MCNELCIPLLFFQTFCQFFTSTLYTILNVTNRNVFCTKLGYSIQLASAAQGIFQKQTLMHVYRYFPLHHHCKNSS